MLTCDFVTVVKTWQGNSYSLYIDDSKEFENIESKSFNDFLVGVPKLAPTKWFIDLNKVIVEGGCYHVSGEQ